ncbi:MAG: hypothetical protein KJZ83_02460 [Burkholderiaceae bacterium]|nr:hypothetical protein [Burkholderiaceae bacterium]
MPMFDLRGLSCSQIVRATPAPGDTQECVRRIVAVEDCRTNFDQRFRHRADRRAAD